MIAHDEEDTMTLAPLLSASPAIKLHAFAAMAAFALGAVQLAAPKGTLPHRTLGWIFAALMVVVAVSSRPSQHHIRLWGPFSPIHLLSIFTLITLPMGVWSAHRHRVRHHRRAMQGLFFGRPVFAGLLTFLPAHGGVRTLVVLKGSIRSDAAGQNGFASAAGGAMPGDDETTDDPVSPVVSAKMERALSSLRGG